MAWPTLMAYLRLVTNPAIVAAPLSTAEALENCRALMALPHVRMLSELEGFWDVYVETTRGISVRGNLVPDAHVAALLKQHGVRRLYTNDADFRRFAFLEVVNPLQDPRRR